MINLIHFGDHCAPGILINHILKITKKQLFMLGMYYFNDIIKYLSQNNLSEIYNSKYLFRIPVGMDSKDCHTTIHTLYNFRFNHDFIYNNPKIFNIGDEVNVSTLKEPLNHEDRYLSKVNYYKRINNLPWRKEHIVKINSITNTLDTSTEKNVNLFRIRKDVKINSIINYEKVKNRFNEKITNYNYIFLSYNTLHIFVNFTEDVDNLNIRGFKNIFENINYHLIIFTNNNYKNVYHKNISVIKLKNKYSGWYRFDNITRNRLYKEIYLSFIEVLNHNTIKHNYPIWDKIISNTIFNEI